MPRLNNPSSTASSVRSLRRGRYVPLSPVIPWPPPFVRAKRESKRERGGKRSRSRKSSGVRSLDALSTTYLPTVEPARPVSRPPRYTKEFPAALPLLKRPPANRRGDPQHVPRRIFRPPSDSRSPMTIERFEKSRFQDQSPNRVARSRSSSCLFAYVGTSS